MSPIPQSPRDTEIRIHVLLLAAMGISLIIIITKFIRRASVGKDIRVWTRGGSCRLRGRGHEPQEAPEAEEAISMGSEAKEEAEEEEEEEDSVVIAMLS